jgi:hypothetical protein
VFLHQYCLYALTLGDPNEQNIVTKYNINTSSSKGWHVLYTTNGENWSNYYPTPVPTGVNAAETQTSDAPAYNLGGQRVNNAYKGIVIQNGRKIKK